MAFDREAFLAKHGSNAQAREHTYEEAVVRHILKKSGQLGLFVQVVDFCRREVGMDGLYLAGFNSLGAFPLWLTSAKVANLDDRSWLEFMRQPVRHPIVQRFAEKQVDFPDQVRARMLGMAFQWPGWDKFVLVHQRDHAGVGDTPRYSWYGGRDKQLHVIETLDNFLQAHELYVRTQAEECQNAEMQRTSGTVPGR
jgi:hypothetical protein